MFVIARRARPSGRHGFHQASIDTRPQPFAQSLPSSVAKGGNLGWNTTPTISHAVLRRVSMKSNHSSSRSDVVEHHVDPLRPGVG